MKINLAKNIKSRLVSFINDNRNHFYVPEHLTVEELLCDDDSYSDWLDFHWTKINQCDMLVVRDFMTWSYLLDTEAAIPMKVEYYFAESE
jgi:hypothetical protein